MRIQKLITFPDMKPILCLILTVLLVSGLLCACGAQGPQPTQTTPTNAADATLPALVDYAGQIELKLSSDTVKEEVTVKTFIDGDTVHFNVSPKVHPSGVLKGRFLAINTPESTGKIEEYGKAASAFTRQKLEAATSIIIESDDGKWNADSTGDRYLIWVWYRTDESQPYRNLNIEILQEGLAIANSSANNRYGSVCTAAINQARAYKYNVHSGQRDPDFFYGDAVELTLKELRTNVASYNGMKVAFSGVITMNDGGSIYIEDFDEETGLYYGISVYYGYGLPGAGLNILSMGNCSRIVGTVQYYEVGGTYQVSGLSYRQMKPDDPNNIQKISEGHSPAYVPTDADTFMNSTVSIELEEGPKEFPYAELAMNTSIEMKGLTVESVYTTNNEDSASNGAMTLTCVSDGVTVLVRTTVLYDENKALITADAYEGKTIDVRGIVDYYDGTYQIKVFSANGITVN